MKIINDKNIISGLISWRMVDTILPSKDAFLERLYSGSRLKFYFGIDPTAPDIHIGHAANLFFLRDMQRLGHEVTMLVGDFTARIGDPTGKDTARRPITDFEVRANAKTYRRQANKLLDFGAKKNPAKMVFNSSWLSRLCMKDFMEISSNLTVQQLLEREMFQRRISRKEPISLNEFMYPVFQGYDSVFLDADVEVGGGDQLFNMMTGRKLMAALKKKDKLVVTTRLLINPRTGRKLMSKSEGNYVSLADSSEEMYGKIMALPDDVIWECFELATDIPENMLRRIKEDAKTGESLRRAKAKLAETIVSWAHSKKDAMKAEKTFDRIFVKRTAPENAKTVTFRKGQEKPAVDLLVETKMVSSKSEAGRLIKGGGFYVNDNAVLERRTVLRFEKDAILRVGRRKFLRVRVK